MVAATTSSPIRCSRPHRVATSQPYGCHSGGSSFAEYKQLTHVGARGPMAVRMGAPSVGTSIDVLGSRCDRDPARAANRTNAGARPPREGCALCQGIIACGSCGKPMRTNYHSDQRPSSECSSRADRLTTRPLSSRGSSPQRRRLLRPRQDERGTSRRSEGNGSCGRPTRARTSHSPRPGRFHRSPTRAAVRKNHSAASVNARRESSHEKPMQARLDASRARPRTARPVPRRRVALRGPWTMVIGRPNVASWAIDS
jgi:hypothetical protein